MTMGHCRNNVGGSVGIQISFIKNLDLSIVPLEKCRAMVSHLLGFLIFT